MTTSANSAQIQLTSAAFAFGDKIPVRFTCEGDDVSPPLQWRGAPLEARSFALIMDDPDAPRGTWVHWLLYNIPAAAVELTQAVPTLPETPSGARHGRNTAGDMAYAGPCPPPGKPHRYFFRLYALDTLLSLTPGASRAELEEAMNQHILGQGELMGTYQHRP
jgi:Raf kinase inhibitor-like YbhB/YbcL family protein